ncbi:hypothetical protein MHU86_7414 [Fragilaria crotonensis]|nr:hypothetical protein MHU86_7414 [Fragilaria crotonensis]
MSTQGSIAAVQGISASGEGSNARQSLESAQAQWKNLFSRNMSQSNLLEDSDQHARQPSSLTRSNQRENNPWADILTSKAPNCTRVILYDTVKQYWHRTKFIAGTTPIPFRTHYKPGGTFLLTIGSLSGRIIRQTQDRWGRWVVQECVGRSGTKLVIASAYQPVDKRGQDGNLTVAGQQRSLLLQSQDALGNPRSAFRRDLLKELLVYQRAGADILLVGDFNEAFGSDPDGLSFVAGELKLVNLSACRHSSKVPATYARGSKCLDYALGSPRLQEALVRMGYDAFNARLSSDHRGFFLDFDTVKLFGSPTQDLATPARRMLKATNPCQVTAYINTMYEFLEEHNAFRRGERLTYAGNRHQYAEKLDRDVLAASLAAEAHIPQFNEPAWSVALATARRRVQYLRKCLSAFRNALDSSIILQEYSVELPTDELPRNQGHCSRLLRWAKMRSDESSRIVLRPVALSVFSASTTWKNQFQSR